MLSVISDYKTKLILHDGSHPIIKKPRQVLYAMKVQVEKESDRLENLQIITEVEKSGWGTSVVLVVCQRWHNIWRGL